MAMTRLAAKQYVARALGAEGNATQLAAALDAINAAVEEWNLRRDWKFLRMDTRDGFSVGSVTSDGLTPSTLTTTATNGFAGVNVGQTVTNSALATSTVASVTSTTVIVLAGLLATGTGTFSFSGDIPVIANTGSYWLPTLVKRPMSARLVVNERTLEWMDQFVIDKMFQNQTPTSIPTFYNLFNPTTFTQSRQTGKVTLFPIPSTAETLRVRYYRPIVEPGADGDFIDLPDRYIFAMLELARWNYLKNHDAETERLMMTGQKAEALYRQCVADDEGESQDRDPGFVAQIDHALQHQIITDEIAGWP